MSRVLLRLLTEHVNAGSLLNVLEGELGAIVRRAGPRYRLLVDVMAYFESYPRLCHHPKEDLVYRTLAATAPEAARSVTDLLAEHRRVGELTDCLSEIVARAAREPGHHDRELVRTATTFVEAYREHMTGEEREFFPLAQRILTDDDWASMDFEVFEASDPIFDEVTEDRFAALRELTLAEAERTERRRRLEDDARAIATFESLEEFNLAMEAMRRSYRLHAAGSDWVELRADDRLITMVPRAPEAGAVRAALYFLCGLERDLSMSGLRATTARRGPPGEGPPL